jgi:hypothetical protein
MLVDHLAQLQVNSHALLILKSSGKMSRKTPLHKNVGQTFADEIFVVNQMV